jgi:hypothetical protein
MGELTIRQTNSTNGDMLAPLASKMMTYADKDAGLFNNNGWTGQGLFGDQDASYTFEWTVTSYTDTTATGILKMTQSFTNPKISDVVQTSITIPRNMSVAFTGITGAQWTGLSNQIKTFNYTKAKANITVNSDGLPASKTPQTSTLTGPVGLTFGGVGSTNVETKINAPAVAGYTASSYTATSKNKLGETVTIGSPTSAVLSTNGSTMTYHYTADDQLINVNAVYADGTDSGVSGQIKTKTDANGDVTLTAPTGYMFEAQTPVQTSGTTIAATATPSSGGSTIKVTAMGDTASDATSVSQSYTVKLAARDQKQTINYAYPNGQTKTDSTTNKFGDTFAERADGVTFPGYTAYIDGSTTPAQTKVVDGKTVIVIPSEKPNEYKSEIVHNVTYVADNQLIDVKALLPDGSDSGVAGQIQTTTDKEGNTTLTALAGYEFTSTDVAEITTSGIEATATISSDGSQITVTAKGDNTSNGANATIDNSHQSYTVQLAAKSHNQIVHYVFPKVDQATNLDPDPDPVSKSFGEMFDEIKIPQFPGYTSHVSTSQGTVGEAKTVIGSEATTNDLQDKVYYVTYTADDNYLQTIFFT